MHKGNKMKNVIEQETIKQKTDKILNEMFPNGVDATIRNAVFYDLDYYNIISADEITLDKIQGWIDKHFEITE